MKKALLIISLFIFSLTISAQQLDGIYLNGQDSIMFSGKNVSFRISGFAGLSTVQVGKGTYEIIDNFMLINTTEYPGPKTTYSAQPTSRIDTCNVMVVGVNNYAQPGILVESKNGSGKVIGASVTGSDGRVIITDYDKVSKLSISAMGFNPITFDFSPGNDFVVRVVENDIIENKTAALRFNKIDDETISLILLTDDLGNYKDLSKELSKLNKRARKTNLIEKRYIKELPVYTR